MIVDIGHEDVMVRAEDFPMDLHFVLFGLDDFCYCQIFLGYEQDYYDVLAIASETDAHVGAQRVHEYFSLFVHLEEYIGRLDEKLLRVLLRNIDVIFILGDNLAGGVVNQELLLFSQPAKISLINVPILDTRGILHSNRRQCQILIQNSNLLKLSLLINIKHDLRLNFQKRIDISFKRLIHIVIALALLLAMDIPMMFLVEVAGVVLFDCALVIVVVFVAVVELEVVVALFGHFWGLKLYFKC